MTPTQSPIQKLDLSLVERIADIAVAAGEKILELRDAARAGFVEKPDDQGPVTIADRAANDLIVGELNTLFPQDLVVAEESWSLDTPVPLHPSAWFVDPLDGTKGFVSGGDDYSVIIGHATKGVPDLGAIFHPTSLTTWIGHAPSKRVWRSVGQEPLCLMSAPREPQETPIVACSRSHNVGFAEAIGSELGFDTVHRGSVGLKATMITDGEAHAYFSSSQYIKMWDTCAPVAILAANGHVMTNLFGEPLRYHGKCSHLLGVSALAQSIRPLWPQVDTAVRKHPRGQALLSESQPT